MRGGPPSVVTSHPAKQVVVYDTVMALQVSGVLQRHLAAVYYQPNRFPFTLIGWLPSARRQVTVREMGKRRAELDDRLVVSFPYVELLVRAVSAIKPLRRFRWHGSAYLATSFAHDLFASWWLARNPAPTVFMGFQGAARRSLRTAHRRGSATILNVTHPLSHGAIVASEYARLGLSLSFEPPRKLILEALSADYCITASALTTNSLVAVGVARDRIFEIPYGINLDRFPPRSIRRDTIFRVVFVGKLTIHKGFQFLLEAWQQLALPKSELVLLGRPIHPEDSLVLNRYDARLYRLISEVGNVRDVYAEADVFVLPSLVEGFGMVTLEAMASGLPVIVSENARSVARDGVDGYIVPNADVDALQDRIRRLYDDRELRVSMGREARRQAERFSMKRYYGCVREVIDTVAASSRTAVE